MRHRYTPELDPQMAGDCAVCGNRRHHPIHDVPLESLSDVRDRLREVFGRTPFIGEAERLLSELHRRFSRGARMVRLGELLPGEPTREALDFAFAKVPGVNPALKERLLEAYWTLDCYEEVPAMLRALKDVGARTAILSNGSPDMLAAAVRNSALDDLLDEVYSVDALRCFKTDPRVYETVTLDWKLYPSAVSFQSSNRWDIAGAAKFGFHCVWINRTGQPDEYKHLAPARILPSLAALV